MAKTIPWLIVYLSSILATSCIHRAASLRMLEERADYGGKELAEASELRLGDNEALRDVGGGIPVRTAPTTAHIWIFPHETSGKEYFWGGWLSVVVEGDRWEIESPTRSLPSIPKKTGGAKVNPKTKKTKKGGA